MGDWRFSCPPFRQSLYISDLDRFSVLSDGSLSIGDVGWLDRGDYECVVVVNQTDSDAYGNGSNVERHRVRSKLMDVGNSLEATFAEFGGLRLQLLVFLYKLFCVDIRKKFRVLF
jgi:hypothetical protein